MWCLTVVEDFIFVMGGWVGSEIAENIERYDPDLDQWVVVGKVETKRFHLGVAEMDGLIYVAGKFIVIFYYYLCCSIMFEQGFFYGFHQFTTFNIESYRLS